MKKPLFLSLTVALLFLFSCSKPSTDPTPDPITINTLQYGKPCTTCTEIDHQEYYLCHDNTRKVPLWTVYELTAADVANCVTRVDNFTPEPALAAGQRSELADYVGSGYDRGHMVPANDMCRSREVMDKSFYLSNMVPQNGSLNSGRWNQIESKIHAFCTQQPVWVYTGPVFTSPSPITIGANSVVVPDALYKIIIYVKHGATHAIAFYALNVAPPAGNTNRDFLDTIDDIESKTGLDFLSTIDDTEESAIESTLPTEEDLVAFGI